LPPSKKVPKEVGWGGAECLAPASQDALPSPLPSRTAGGAALAFLVYITPTTRIHRVPFNNSSTGDLYGDCGGRHAGRPYIGLRKSIVNERRGGNLAARQRLPCAKGAVILPILGNMTEGLSIKSNPSAQCAHWAPPLTQGRLKGSPSGGARRAPPGAETAFPSDVRPQAPCKRATGEAGS